MTKKEIFQKMHGQRVVVTYEGMRTQADDATLRQEILTAMEREGIPATELREDDNSFTIGTQFWRKSKLIQGDTGVLTVRSKDFIFKRDRDGGDVYGDIPKADALTILPDGDGFTKRLERGGFITYRIAA
jgi:hypothetical protein